MVTNEYSKLQKVIVGSATNAKIPHIDKSVRCINYADLRDDELDQIKVGPYPKQVIDEANEDLDTFCLFLESEGVEVLRPFETDCQYYNYCPRDSVFIHKDIAIATPMPIRARRGEYKAFAHHIDIDIQDIDPAFTDACYDLSCVNSPDILATANTQTPMFDAANCLRSNDDVLYLLSNSGNIAGAQYLSSIIDAKVGILQGVYSYMHIDSTIAFLREGLMLVNPSRIKSKDVLPAPFNKWDIIQCPEPVDIGYYENYCNASVWINMNLFSVNENLVVLEQHQEPLARELKKHGIDSALLPMRHQRTLGGGFHCVTLDLDRVD